MPIIVSKGPKSILWPTVVNISLPLWKGWLYQLYHSTDMPHPTCTLRCLDIIQIFPPSGPPLPLPQVETTDQVFAENQHLDLGPRLKALQVWGWILLLCHPVDGRGDPQPKECGGGEQAEGGPVLLPLLPALPPRALLEGRDRDLPLPLHGRALHDHPNHPLQPLLFSHLAWGSTACLQGDRWTGF